MNTVRKVYDIRDLNGERFVVVFGGDVWELEETINDWHLVRHGVTLSMPKLMTGWVGQVPIEETFAQFQARLNKLDKEREGKK